ncbi:hypothetical protein ACWEVP_37270 [Amycolatopsis sp. NPDC003865]
MEEQPAEPADRGSAGRGAVWTTVRQTFGSFKREFYAVGFFAAVVAVVSDLGGIYGQIFAIGPWGLALALATILMITIASAVRRAIRSKKIAKRQVVIAIACLIAVTLVVPGAVRGTIGLVTQDGIGQQPMAAPKTPPVAGLSSGSVTTSNSDDPTIPTSPPSATLTSAPPATTGPAPRPRLQAMPSAPGGCSKTVTLTGAVNGDARAAGKDLWVVAELLAAPENGNKDHFYAKAPVDVTFSGLTIGANTKDSGTRTGRYLLIAAAGSASADLRRNYEADQLHIGVYKDEWREHLPDGATIVTETPDIVQSC